MTTRLQASIHGRQHRKPAFAGRGVSLAAMALAASLSGAPAWAQDAASDQDTNQVDDIIVTALKTGAQQLDRVPLAIQAFSEETLKDRGVRDGADLMQLIPGASQAQEIGAGYRVFSFRGSGAGGPVGDGMIGYYLDDTPFGVPNFQAAPPVQYFDLDQVEVLRGPQGTLYGSGSMGGTIIYRTRNPTLDRFTAQAEGEVSTTANASDPNYRVAGAVSIPIVEDVLGIRLSGGYDRRQGYNDIYSGAPTGTPRETDANTVIAEDLQAVVLWRPNADTSVRLRAWKFSTDQDYLNVMNSIDPPYASFQGDVVGFDHRRSEYYSSTITHDFENFTLTNATSYQKSLPGGFQVGLNLGAPLGIGTLNNGGNSDSFVNEFRLATSGDGPLHAVGGVFYQKAEGLYTFNIAFPTLNLNGETITRTENASIFSEVSYDLMGGKLVPLIGLRYFRDTRSSDSISNGVAVSSESKPDKVTWRANVAYYPTEDWMVFVNAGTGFRSGILQSQAQADAVIADGVPSSIALTPDELLNLEVGTKGTLFDGALRLATSVYQIDYKNLQAAFNTSIGLSAFANLGDTRTRGIDIEASWDTPLDGLTLGVIGNVNDSKFRNVEPEFAAANPRYADGEDLINTPPYNWRLDANYDRNFGRYDFFANASMTAVGRNKNGDATVDTLDPYQLYRAAIGIRWDEYEVRLYGENLADERGPTASNGPTLLAGPRPRTVGITLRMDLN
ncbi:TonB-dependent receptor [Brevundimonas sp. R86498]|uniref:TonB-dependent receptor n=1 Tax=Brevundimonas sp. R86498 TaxID=3093845 RepID=UPI0037C7CE9F